MVRHLWLSAAAAGLALACQETGGPSAQFRADLEIVAGDAQIDTVAKELPVAITARVLDSTTRLPRAGVLVNWVVVQGGGSVFAGAALSNDSGLARERWTLGTTAGPQRLEARAVDPNTGQPVVYAQVTATAMPGPMATAHFQRRRYVVLGDSVVTLDVSAADAYGNAVTPPTIQALDSLPIAGRDVTASLPGIFRYVVASDTVKVFVHPPTGAYRAAQYRFSEGTVRIQTAQLAIRNLRLVSGSLCDSVQCWTDTISVAEYEGQNYLAVRHNQDGTVDTMTSTGTPLIMWDEPHSVISPNPNVQYSYPFGWPDEVNKTGTLIWFTYYLDRRPPSGRTWTYVAVSGGTADTMTVIHE